MFLRKLSTLFAFLFLLFLSSCQEEDSNKDYLFSVVSSEESNIDFSNDLPIQIDLNIFNYMYYYNGGGVAVGDLNNDDLIDIIFSSNLEKEAIYINKGNLQFEDISNIAQVDGGEKSWTTGVALADLNQDGFLDIYLSQVGDYRELDSNNKLFICQGLDENNNPLYKEESAQYGLNFKGFSTQAGFFDYDLDGDLDLFLMNHSLHHNGTFGQRKDFLNTYNEKSGDRLYRNDNGSFVDVTKESGIHSSVIGYGLGLAFGDLNNDGYPDIYVGNDFHENDYLYINQGDGTFIDKAENQLKHTSRFSMGIDIADVNEDGHQDIISLDMLPEDPFILKSSEGEDALDIFNFKLGYGYNHQYAKNALQLNQGNGTFKEIASYAGVHATDWSWSPLLFDFDMDGQKDLFISNGIPKRMNDIDYINFISGHDIQYKIQFNHLEKNDLSALEKIPEIKLPNKFYLGGEKNIFSDQKDNIQNQNTSYSNSAAYADFDNDGDYDLICNNINQKAFLYENNSKTNESVQVKLKGNKANSDGIGSKIISYYQGQAHIQEYYSTRGFQSSMLSQIIIPKKNLDSVKVVWNTGETETKKYVEDNSIAFEYSANLPKHTFTNEVEEIELVDITEAAGVVHKHKENPFVEFNREPLIPFSNSTEGPALAVGDINNDGLDDFFIGSAKRKRNKLYLQQSNGTFKERALEGTVKDSIYEEVDAVFADLDGDNFKELIIATGGNEYRLNSEFTTQSLYKNNQGNLIRDEEAFDKFHTTASCVVAEDMDNDGDIDLFFGGRATPWDYGIIPESFLLENDGKGNFTNVSEKWLSGLSHIGFVRDAEWADMNGDNIKDLVIALEWGGIKILFNDHQNFKEADLTKLQGWWNNLVVEDVDNDGDLDVFAGNLGENSRLKISENQTVKMYFNDFDDNGKKEQIVSYYVGGRELPFNNFAELQKQMPALKKTFLYAKDFARADIADIFGKEKMAEAEVFEANYFKSSLFLNDGNGNFSIADLPIEMQYTSYHAGWFGDVNGDGKTDLVPGGNFYNCNVQMGRYDAENGSVLLNQGNNNFRYLNLKNSPISGQVKYIKPITIKDQKAIIVAQNNGPLKILKIK